MPHDAPILVVDDDPKIVSLICLYLERDGFRTISAFDGVTALDMAQKQSPLLVVLDLLLPGVTGLEVCKRMRERSDVPVLMLTAKVEEDDKLTGLGLGADDYMTKPFSPREVVAVGEGDPAADGHADRAAAQALAARGAGGPGPAPGAGER